MRNTFARLLKLSASFVKWMGLAALLGFATIASGIGLMTTSGYLISKAAVGYLPGSAQPSIADLQIAIVGVRFFGISRGVFRYLERLVSHDVTFRLLARLYHDHSKHCCFRHYLSGSMQTGACVFWK